MAGERRHGYQRMGFRRFADSARETADRECQRRKRLAGRVEQIDRQGNLAGQRNPLGLEHAAAAEDIEGSDGTGRQRFGPSVGVRPGFRQTAVECGHRYVCPSVVANKDVVYAIGGGHTSLAVRTGGSGDVTKTHGIWRQTKGSNVGSPVYYQGHLYWASDGGGYVCCQDAKTGKTVFQQRLTPRPGRFWTSPVLADGKLYFVSQHKGVYVVAAKPKFEFIAHNTFADDNSRTNASPAFSNGRIFLRTDRKLYCIGGK